MSDLPRVARWYLYTLWGVAASLILYILLQNATLETLSPLLLIWLVAYVCADYVEFEIGEDKPVSMTIADAPMIFLVAISGATGALVILIGTFIVDLIRWQRPWYRSLFNASARVITYMMMWLVYWALMEPGALPFSGFRGLVALLLVGGIYYILNTLLVATIIAFATSRPLLGVYRDSYQVVRWIHFITLPLGAVLAALWVVDPWLALPALIPLIMAQRSFKALADWQAESRRSKELAREAQQLAGKLERLQDATTAMIASLDAMPLLKTVSTRLAALLEASASWVILLDQQRAHLVAPNGIASDFDWDAPAYAAEIQKGLRLLDPADMARLHHDSGARWQSLVIIPLALEQHVLGGICLALDRPITLAEDDRRVLMSFAAQATLAMEHARLFEELRHKQDELVRSSKLAALGTFSAGIAHEFNNLLAGILGYAQLGLNSEDVADKNEALEVAVRSCMRGRSITSGLLTFARRGEPQRGLHLIQEALEDVIVLVERELAKNNIRMERHIQAVPPTICDPGQLAQVMLNLMTNARDAMIEHGGVITVSLSERDDQIELLVADTGSGIPEDLLDQVFQPFMTTKGALGGSVTPGAGLGLAISYGIIQSHDGTITIDSEVGVGTTVTIRLPIVTDMSVSGGKQISTAAAPGLRILVVDDEPMIIDSVVRLLEAEGHRMVSAADGASGLRRYCEQPFDLVLTDIVMPGMSGAEFVQRLRAIDPEARVLIMTGHMAPAQIDQLLNEGAVGVVTKPFIVKELLAAVARSVDPQSLHTA
jgi:signal transduction histidine kinase/ActR/RegA family two-component response regulator